MAWRAPLSPDEAYYWVWARALAWGYLDHPPMVALWIRAGVGLLGPVPLGVRLLCPLAAMLGTVLLARAAEDFFPGRRAGLVAGTLFNATLAMGVGSVVMTPDTPLLLFWTAGLAALGRLLATGRAGWWLAFGVAAGLAVESKYTGFLLGGGVLLWLVLCPGARRWFATWQLWAAAALALAIIAPMAAWNLAHGLAGFAKQGGRAGQWQPARAVQFLGELIVGQIGLATPAVFCLFGLGLARAWRGRGSPAALLLLCLSLPAAAIFIQHVLGDRVQANWPTVIYPAAAIAAAGLAQAGWRWSAALGFALAAPVYLQAAAAPLPLPRAADLTLIRMAGWPALADGAQAAARGAAADFIAADEYGLAAELAWHLPVRVLGAEPRWALFRLGQTQPEGVGLLVRSTRRKAPPDPAYWAAVRPIGTLARGRGGVIAETYTLFLVRRRPGAPALAVLPQRALGAD